MSSIGSPSPFFFGGKKEAYAVERSLRFNHGDSPYLSFTPSSTGNQKVWTFSAWIKKTAVTNDRHYIYSANDSNSAYFALYFDNDSICCAISTSSLPLSILNSLILKCSML